MKQDKVNIAIFFASFRTISKDKLPKVRFHPPSWILLPSHLVQSTLVSTSLLNLEKYRKLDARYQKQVPPMAVIKGEIVQPTGFLKNILPSAFYQIKTAEERAVRSTQKIKMDIISLLNLVLFAE